MLHLWKLLGEEFMDGQDWESAQKHPISILRRSQQTHHWRCRGWEHLTDRASLEVCEAIRTLEARQRGDEAARIRNWVERELRKDCRPSTQEGGVHSRLAELRALGALLSCSTDFGDLAPSPIPIRRGKGRSADFQISHGREKVFVEVACKQIAEDEAERRDEVREVDGQLQEVVGSKIAEEAERAPGSQIRVQARATWDAGKRRGTKQKRRSHDVTATSVAHTDGTRSTIVMSTMHESPVGDSAGVDTVAKRLAGLKPNAGQIPPGYGGIFWLDLAAPFWNLPLEATSAVELQSLDAGYVSTGVGIWQSFYGRKDSTPLFRDNLAHLGLCSHQLMSFDGRFLTDAGKKWSAAVLRCTNGIAIYENPVAHYPLPFEMLMLLAAMDGYSIAYSFHRLKSSGFSELNHRLQWERDRLQMYVRNSPPFIPKTALGLKCGTD